MNIYKLTDIESDRLDQIWEHMMDAVRSISMAHKMAAEYGNDDLSLETNCAWLSMWEYYNRVVDIIDEEEGELL